MFPPFANTAQDGAPEKKTKMSDILKVGERAPEFNLPADDGKAVTLADFRGKNVVLFFFPKALTPG